MHEDHPPMNRPRRTLLRRGLIPCPASRRTLLWDLSHRLFWIVGGGPGLQAGPWLQRVKPGLQSGGVSSIQEPSSLRGFACHNSDAPRATFPGTFRNPAVTGLGREFFARREQREVTAN